MMLDGVRSGMETKKDKRVFSPKHEEERIISGNLIRSLIFKWFITMGYHGYDILRRTQGRVASRVALRTFVRLECWRQKQRPEMHCAFLKVCHPRHPRYRSRILVHMVVLWFHYGSPQHVFSNDNGSSYGSLVFW